LTVSTPSQRPTPLGDFGRHNLVQDAPISRMDLLVCRNSLMYFNAEAQAKIITRFAFALNEGGCFWVRRRC